jgi:hypothetical protein
MTMSTRLTEELNRDSGSLRMPNRAFSKKEENVQMDLMMKAVCAK